MFDPGTDVKIDFSYRRSRIKQYVRDGRALRIEAVIYKPSDLGILARVPHGQRLDYGTATNSALTSGYHLAFAIGAASWSPRWCWR